MNACSSVRVPAVLHNGYRAPEANDLSRAHPASDVAAFHFVHDMRGEQNGDPAA
jgi:hypothetical protein